MTSHPEGSLVLAATPIGSHLDASASLKDLLSGADIIAAEDTRLFAKLVRRLGVEVDGRIVSYFEGNEESRTGELLEVIAAGGRVALVSDAGMPAVSDPGFRLVSACIEQGHRVTAVPGPSAVLTALAVSGMATDRFCFEGFLPRKDGARRERLHGLVGEERTMIFFEAPHRLQEFLVSAGEVLGPRRRAAVCRELTKPHEEIVRDTLEGLARWAEGGVRGEVTVVVAGAEPVESSLEDAVAVVMGQVAQGVKLSAAVREVSEVTGTPRKQLYEAALAARNEGSRRA